MDAAELLLAKAHEYELPVVSLADAASLSEQNESSAVGSRSRPSFFERALTRFEEAARLEWSSVGWHDVCVRCWDISTTQAVVGRLNALPAPAG